MRLTSLKIFVLVLFILILFGLNLLIGSVDVPFKYVMGIIVGNKTENELWNYIVIENRLPQALPSFRNRRGEQQRSQCPNAAFD